MNETNPVRVVSLTEMYRTFSASLFDVTNDLEDKNENGIVTDMLPILRALLVGDVKTIRQAFIDGFTMMLVPDFDEDIEEVRITDAQGVVMMVVVGDEINY
jgi:hypothetical protein